MGVGYTDYNDERAKEFAERASEEAKKHKEHKAEWDARLSEMKSKKVLTLDEQKLSDFEERQRKALERREKFLARKGGKD